MTYSFILAPDSFKESMTAKEAVTAMSKGIRHVFPDATIYQIPLADGGEGTLDVISEHADYEKVTRYVMGPFFDEVVPAIFLYNQKNKTAILELAQTSGLELVAKEKRTPLTTTTFGTGQCVLEAVKLGAKKIILAVGGSATHDLGFGILQACGVRFFTKQHVQLPNGQLELSKIATLTTDTIDPSIKDLEVIVASDVENPLYGIQGAAQVFAKQKGATANEILQLEKETIRLAQTFNQKNKHDLQTAGMGAAGGILFGLSLVNERCRRISGIDWVLDEVNLERYVTKETIVFTGEGKIDCQTEQGKVIAGVIQRLATYQVPIVAFGGSVEKDLDLQGITACFSITPTPISLKEALRDGADNLTYTVEQVCRILA